MKIALEMVTSILDKLKGFLTTSLLGLISTGAFVWLTESKTLAWRFRSRVAPAVHQEITLIALDETFAEDFGHPKITPRGYLANLVERIAPFRPRVLGINYKITLNDREIDPKGYERLVAAIAGTDNVVLPGKVHVTATPLSGKNRELEMLPSIPPPRFRAVATVGIGNLWGQPVEKARLCLPVAESPAMVPSFALSLAIRGIRRNAKAACPPPADLKVPGSARGEIMISYVGRIRKGDARFRVLSASELTAAPGPRTIPIQILDDFLRDRIVLIGSTYIGDPSQDSYETPFGPMSAVEVHFNILNALLGKHYLRSVSPGWRAGLIAVSVGIACLAFWRLPLLWALVATLGYLLLLYPAACLQVFDALDLALPMALPMQAGFLAILLLYTNREWSWSNWFRFQVKRYEGFELAVEPCREPDTYRVTAHGSAADGQPASEVVIFRAEDPVAVDPSDGGKCDTVAHAVALWRRGAADRKHLVALGQALFDRFLVNEVESAFRRAMRRGWWLARGIRIVLRIEALQDLPWELLYDAQGGGFAATQPNFALTRIVAAETAPPALDSQALHVLVLLALSEADEPALDLACERRLLDRLERTLRYQEHDTIRFQVREVIGGEPLEGSATVGFQIVHLVGQTLAPGEAWLESLSSLGRLYLLILELSRPPALSSRRRLSSFLEDLARYPVGPHLLVMPVTMSDAGRALFLQSLYHALGEGRRIEEAVVQGRRALVQQKAGPWPRDFSVPVLLTRESAAAEARIDA